MDKFLERLREVIPSERIHLQEPMSRHTTFRVGGSADYYIEPEDTAELAAVLDACREEQMPYAIVGNGSNLLVGDLGYRGVIVALGKAWTEVFVTETEIRAKAGALLSSVAKQAFRASLTGLEFAAGIPGTVGGAVVMNAGAYGSEMAAVLKTVTVLDQEGRVRTLPVSELRLGYRTSCIASCGYVVLEAEFSLQEGETEKIKNRMDELAIQRRSKQPLEYPSAGSTFKRPEGYFAGKLIQDAGLRGYRVGGAQVSEKHCGFVINRDHATAAEIKTLCETVQQKVKEQFGVKLELEVKLLGEF